MSFARSILVLGTLSAIPIASQAQATAAGSTPGSFRVTESGAAEYRIPIHVPPGIASMEPKLALFYNSQAGNGLLGVGWNLEGLSEITRCPRTMAQDGVRGGVNYDWNDRYCLDGQRLILVSGSSYGVDAAEYRTERESFSKVVSYGVAGNGPAWFKVWTKEGQILEYGNTADSRIEAQGKTTVRVWAVNKVSDRKGNYFAGAYDEDINHIYHRPLRIDYTGNSLAEVPSGNSVLFHYEGRADNLRSYVAGSGVVDWCRLSGITSYSAGIFSGAYQLAYQASPSTGASRLASVRRCFGADNC